MNSETGETREEENEVSGCLRTRRPWFDGATGDWCDGYTREDARREKERCAEIDEAQRAEQGNPEEGNG